MRFDVHNLSTLAVVYAVYLDDELVHLGESDAIARPATYVENLKRKESGRVHARYIEISDELRGSIALPSELESSSLYHGNLERLLQAAYFWQHRRLPRRDKVRGGKGADADATGGFVRDLDVLARTFELLATLIGPRALLKPWPTLPPSPPTSLAPHPTAGRGRPATRARYLAFWASLSQVKTFIGHLPVVANAPHYSAPTKSVVWSAGCPT
jgi:hypothetical protein